MQNIGAATSPPPPSNTPLPPIFLSTPDIGGARSPPQSSGGHPGLRAVAAGLADAEITRRGRRLGGGGHKTPSEAISGRPSPLQNAGQFRPALRALNLHGFCGGGGRRGIAHVDRPSLHRGREREGEGEGGEEGSKEKGKREVKGIEGEGEGRKEKIKQIEQRKDGRLYGWNGRRRERKD